MGNISTQIPIPKELLDLLDPNIPKNRQIENVLKKALNEKNFIPETMIRFKNKIPTNIYINDSILNEIKSRGWKINRTIYTALILYKNRGVHEK